MTSAANMYIKEQYQTNESLFHEHIPLVKTISYQIGMRLPPGKSIEDLIQVGMIGLLEASRAFDSGMGASFKSYASIRIRGAIIDELRKQSWMPRSIQQKSKQLTQAIQKVEGRLGRAATDREIANELNETLEDYSRNLEAIAGTSVFSLDDDSNYLEAESGDGSPLKNIQDESLKKKLSEVISGLPDQEKLVIALYYDQELNLREIGEVLEVSESRVCQIHSQAVGRIRSRMTEWIEN